MLRGCSRTLKTPNSPPLDPVTSFCKLDTPNFVECLLDIYFVISPNLKRLLALVA